MASTKNLGLVAGISVGNTPPSNTLLIWYDNNTSEKKHKVYDVTQRRWVSLNPQIVKATTYSELVNSANNNGLSVGSFFKITDKSNVLATAITTTKVQYSDTKGNVIVDDLGKGKEFHISSSNLLIDGLNATFNEATNQLVFLFTDDTPNYDTDYLLGKKKNGTKWSFFKMSFSKLISPDSGNAISWSNGLFFNFTKALNLLINKKGGIVGRDIYDRDVLKLQRQIDIIGKNNQNIVSGVNANISSATSDNSIFSKKLPLNPNLSGNAGDAKQGDTLFNIVSMFQRWINKLKFATGVRLSLDYADAKTQEYVNNNDTVQSAIGKIQYWMKNIGSSGTLSSDWRPKHGVDNDGMPVAGDSLDEAFSKAIGKLNQLGIITSGRLMSSGKTSNGNPRTSLWLDDGYIQFNNANKGYGKYNSDSIELVDSNNDTLSDRDSNANGLKVTPESFFYKASDFNHEVFLSSVNDYVANYAATVFKSSSRIDRGYNSTFALTAINDDNRANSFDAGFSKILLGRIAYKMKYVEDSTYTLANNESFIVCRSTENQNIYLPDNPARGTVIYIVQSGSKGYHVHAQGDNEIDTIGESRKEVSINERGSCYMFIWIPGVYYDSSSNANGLWQCSKMSNAL